jgi:iron complex transport system ATP-binding protein
VRNNDAVPSSPAAPPASPTRTAAPAAAVSAPAARLTPPKLSIFPGPDSVLHLAEVTVRRGNSILLDAVNWNVDVDERWVILGPNGAGKTTLLQIAAAQLFPTSGRVHILGERLGAFDISEIRPRIGLSSAALAGRVPPMESVLDVVVSAGYGVVGRWREQYDDFDFARARELLDAMGIAALADRTYGTLSEGERKRTLAARALMADPELLLLDEPAAGLDLAGREDLLARLAKLAIDPFAPTTLLVTHHVEEIPTAFSHVLLMRGGKVIGAGPMTETLTQESLSETFGTALTLETRAGRFFAYAA